LHAIRFFFFSKFPSENISYFRTTRKMSSNSQLELILPVLQSLQNDVDQYYTRQQAEHQLMYQEALDRIEALRRGIKASSGGGGVGSWGRQNSAGVANNDAVVAPHSAASSANTSAVNLLMQHRQRNQPHNNSATGNAFMPSTPPRHGGGRPSQPVDDDDWAIGRPQAGDVMHTPRHNRPEITPTGSPQSTEKFQVETLLQRFQANNSNSPPFNLETLVEQLTGGDNSPQTTQPPPLFSMPPPMHQMEAASRRHDATIPMDSLSSISGQHQTQSVQVSPELSPSGRPKVLQIKGKTDDPRELSIDPSSRCQVLIEFKRKRVLQFDSSYFVGPGEYVVVGGDRGEDVGLVIYTWCETTSKTVKGIGLTGSSLSRNIGVGMGTVLRIATELETTQLHNVQAELERRAVDVCMQRVLEHGLPMVIVDAEYQFDKKKLTFYFEAQQRMDFRELVRDLFKTFRARIWMELVEN
jgi:hypothetical protein